MATLRCANWKQKDGDVVCPNLGTKACSRCQLVAYCSKECQAAHWPIHKFDCNNEIRKKNWQPAWAAEKRQPTFSENGGSLLHLDRVKYGGNKCLWRDVPALDLLQLKENEGTDESRDLSLLLAASGDLGNLIKTISCLPDGYRGNIHVDINDRDEMVMARTLIILLVAFSLPPEEASEMMLHLWYSVFLPESVSKFLQDKILPLIQSFPKSKPAESANVLQNIWSCGDSKLSAALPRKSWNILQFYFPGASNISFNHASTVMQAVTLASSRTDFRDRLMYRLPPSWRLAKLRFRQDGVLLPFGDSREDFTIPNPTFFRGQYTWPMSDFADPLHGWRLSEVLQDSYCPKSDIYGQLYFHIKGLLLKFCEKIATLHLSINLFHIDAVDLPNQIAELRNGQTPTYDRIELSNVADRDYLGPLKTLGVFGPLLKSRHQNPKATLLTLFLDATYEVCTIHDKESTVFHRMMKVYPYLPIHPVLIERNDETFPYLFNSQHAQELFSDNDALFDRFAAQNKLNSIGNGLSLGMKTTNTVVKKWPTRLSEHPTKDEFNMLFWSGHQGTERYVEWYRKE